jgi:hypothetical protein
MNGSRETGHKPDKQDAPEILGNDSYMAQMTHKNQSQRGIKGAKGAIYGPLGA